MNKILIIEDDPNIAEMISIYLSEEGLDVHWAETGAGGLRALPKFKPDLIILDIMLPDTNGVQLCSELRRITPIPIIIVSAKKEISDKVNSLLLGADDYLCKPFSMRELSARITVQLRRSQAASAGMNLGVGGSNRPDTPSSPPPWKAELKDTGSLPEASPAPIRLDLDQHALASPDKLVELTQSEFEIMKLLWLHPTRVFSRQDFINKIRGVDSFVTERAIDVHIANLRKKIETLYRGEHKYIVTVWGAGYKFIPKPAFSDRPAP